VERAEDGPLAKEVAGSLGVSRTLELGTGGTGLSSLHLTGKGTEHTFVSPHSHLGDFT
jgi:hypothetical protein